MRVVDVPVDVPSLGLGHKAAPHLAPQKQGEVNRGFVGEKSQRFAAGEGVSGVQPQTVQSTHLITSFSSVG